MAENINPGADATLVGAAWRAGVSTAPADYSKTFEGVADSYEKTMEAQAEMWGDIGKVVGVIGADMVANAQEWNNYKDVGEENAAYLVDELEANKQAQKDLGFGAGLFGNKETRDKKRKLKRKQRELFAEIDFVAKSLDDGAGAVAAGLFDENLATQDAEIINAIIKSNLKDKITESGFQTVLSRDEKTDQLVFNLLDRDGNPVTSDATGNRLTMTMKEFNKSIATNVKDTKNVVGTNLGTIINDIVTDAQKGKSGVIDAQTIQLGLNRLDTTLQTDTDWKRAMLAKYGLSNTSFAADLKSRGAVSATTFSSLVQSMGLPKGSQIPAEGAFKGIADTDTTPGLSQEEINAAYSVYTANILGMTDPEASKAAFKASFTDRMGGAHTWGYGKRTIKTDGNGGDKDISLGIKDWTYPEFGRGKINWTSARTIKRRLLGGTGFDYDYDGDGEKERYDYKNGAWYENWENEDSPGTKIGSADDMVLNVLKTNHEAFQNLETTFEAAEIDEEGVEVQVAKKEKLNNDILDDLDVGDDDDASENLNIRFKLKGNRSNPWMFMPYSGTATESTLKNEGGTSFDSPDAGYTNDIMIYNSRTGEVLRDGKKRMRFKTGGDADYNEVARILAALKQNDITIPDPLDPN